MNVLIDGYNLIFECGLHGKKINAESLARGRTVLLNRIKVAHSLAEQRKIAVVFDAKKIPLSGQQAEEFFGGVRVFYSIDFDDADELIELLIARHASPKQLLVVSSDHRLHKAALKRKSQIIDSGDWYDQLEKRVSNSIVEGNVEHEPRIESPLLTDEEISIFKDDVNDQIARQRRRGRNW